MAKKYVTTARPPSTPRVKSIHPCAKLGSRRFHPKRKPQPMMPTAKRTAATSAAGTLPASKRVSTAISPKKSEDTAMTATPLTRGFSTAVTPVPYARRKHGTMSAVTDEKDPDEILKGPSLGA